MKLKSEEIRNRYNQVPHLMGSYKNTRKHHAQESQEVSSFPAGDHKIARNRQDSLTKRNMKDPQKKHRLITVSKKTVPCSLVVICWERADLLALLRVTFSCVSVTFPYDVLGQVWYLIASIPDFCRLPYFLNNFSGTNLTLSSECGSRHIWESDKTRKNTTQKRAKRPALFQQVTIKAAMNIRRHLVVHKG